MLHLIIFFNRLVQELVLCSSHRRESIMEVNLLIPQSGNLRLRWTRLFLTAWTNHSLEIPSSRINRPTTTNRPTTNIHYSITHCFHKGAAQ